MIFAIIIDANTNEQYADVMVTDTAVVSDYWSMLQQWFDDPEDMKRDLSFYLKDKYSDCLFAIEDGAKYRAYTLENFLKLF